MRTLHHLCIALLLTGCLPDGHWKSRGPTEPEDLDDGWQIDTPDAVGLDEKKLATIHDELLREDRHFGTLSFMVIKDRKLVFETYLRDPADRDHYNHIQSVTKTVTSLAFGIARDEGYFPDLSATIDTLLPKAAFKGLSADKHKITLEHLLTMRSGIDFNNDVFSVEIQVDRPSDPLRYILEKPMYAAPGKRFVYRDADPQLLGYVMQHVTGQREEDFLRERVLSPLDITDYYWEPAPDGTTLAPHGLHLRPRDLAKLGLVLLDCLTGRDTFVSQAYCELATQTHIPPEDTLGKRSIRRGFGYYFWTLPDYDAVAAWGHGGQYILLVPDQDLMFVQTALPDSDFLHGGQLEDFVELTAPVFCPECRDTERE